MKIRRLHLWTAIALSAVLLPGCAGTPDALQPNAQLQCRPGDGIGGTGITLAERGMGGTGIDRGMGGTGVLTQDRGMGGTGMSVGVIGTVTGFGSICVNGVHIAYDADTPVSENSMPVSTNALARGQTVAVLAIEYNGQLTAASISLAHTLNGPVTSAPDATGSFAVMGAPVKSAFAVGAEITTLSVGDIVTVDGLQRADGTIDATRIVKAPADTPAFIRGMAEISNDSVRIGAVKVAPPAIQVPSLGDINGQWVIAEGAWMNDQLTANTFAVGSDLNPAAITRLSVEGYLIGGPDTGYKVRGIPIREELERRLARTNLNRLADGQRVQVIGNIERDGSLRIQTIVVPDYLSPLQDSVPSSAPSTSEESRTAAQTREPVQQERGTYRPVVTRPETLNERGLDIRSESRPSRPVLDQRPPIQRPPPPPTRR